MNLSSDQVRCLQPNTLIDFLKKARWNYFQSKRAFLEIYRTQINHQIFEVLIPTNRDYYDDYDRAMLRAVLLVASALNMQPETLLQQLLARQQNAATPNETRQAK